MLFRSRKPEDLKPREIPSGKWLKCKKCGELLYLPKLEENLHVCPHCGYHFRIGIPDYLRILTDTGDFDREIAADLESKDPLNFPQYPEKVLKSQKKTGLREAARVGEATVGGYKTVLFLTDFRFLGGSMGSVVGEKFVRGVRHALEHHLPFVSLTASGGGARMHEGILSLMQMAKTVVGVVELQEARLPYITILADPTMGGVMASFASLGDIILAEPGALLGFAGPRVIRDTIKQQLPPGFQTSEFLLEHGMIDRVVPRHELKETLIRLFNLLGVRHGRG